MSTVQNFLCYGCGSSDLMSKLFDRQFPLFEYAHNGVARRGHPIGLLHSSPI